MVDEEVVNGRLEKTRVDLYSSSSLAKSVASSQVTPKPSQHAVVSKVAPEKPVEDALEEPVEDAPEELVEKDLVVVALASETEEDCRFKVSPSFFLDLSTAGGSSIPGIFAP